jgi:hypothetical protein
MVSVVDAMLKNLTDALDAKGMVSGMTIERHDKRHD